MPGGVNVCMNYEFNLLYHVGVVAKRVCAATAAHEGDGINYIHFYMFSLAHCIVTSC